MSDPLPTTRFTGLASVYARHRPDYPDEALDFIVTRCGLGTGSLLVDVGCGTGIASRQFARRGVQVLGLEPNADMRGQAESAILPPDVPAPVYRAGPAEATGLGDAAADAVLAAQAFHWFEPEGALREFYRVLKPGGWVVLMWNERDEADPFTAEYGSVIHSVPGAETVEASRTQSGGALLASALFEDGACVRFRHQQSLTEDGLLGRAYSTSYAPRDPGPAQALAEALRDLFGRYQHQGQVVLKYRTSVYLARRPGRAGQGQKPGPFLQR